MADTTDRKANIVIVGAGWWTQGWHLPHLSRNPSVRILAVVERSPHPKSNLNPDLESLSALGEKYGCPTFSSIEDVLSHPNLGPEVDGAIVCTPHATHAAIGGLLLREGIRRCQNSSGGNNSRAMNILMEKPFTTNVDEAKELNDLVERYRAVGGTGCFLVNHSANYRAQAKRARELLAAGSIGRVRHVSASFASPLGWIFEDPANTGWNEPDEGGTMLGNGFAWGQSSHLLAWLYHACGNGLRPTSVYCAMGYSEATGADVCHSASVRCEGGATLALSGTSLLPGNAHSDPPVGKQVRIEIYGSGGALFYSGDDRDSSSGRLELRKGASVGRDVGKVEVHCPELGFEFEDLSQEGMGPESLRSFIDACLGKEGYYVGADSSIGLMTIETIDAMYRSNKSGNAELI